MRITYYISCLALVITPGFASAQNSPQAPQTTTPDTPTATGKFTSSETKLAILLADPDASAILLKHAGSLFQQPQFANSKNTGTMTLRELAPLTRSLTEDVLKAIDADFAKIAEKKKK